ncbi:MAG: aldehyde dehydrogenase family protein [Phycisphaerales bacterium JB065]
MAARLSVAKTYKLYIGGAFPRTESGRSIAITDTAGKTITHVCHASRKDFRNAVVAARAAQPGWMGRDAYNRSQILYRMAEMLEGKGEEFAQLIKQTTDADLRAARKEVEASVDRLVAYAGWADKFSQVLGCHNLVVGPYYNFTVPEATGVVVVVAPDEPSLLGLVTLMAPALCSGSTVVALGSEKYPIATSVLGEVCATSDVPGGVINLLTGQRDELIEHIANHRDVNAVVGAGLSTKHGAALRMGASENIKRVRIEDSVDFYDDEACESPWRIEPLVEMKTIWHPSAS